METVTISLEKYERLKKLEELTHENYLYDYGAMHPVMVLTLNKDELIERFSAESLARENKIFELKEEIKKLKRSL